MPFLPARRLPIPVLCAALAALAAAPAPATTRAGAHNSGPSPETEFRARDRAAAPEPKTPWHLFGAPAEDTAAAQMARAKRFEAAGRKSAARKAYDSLVHNWGASPEASEAQLSVARLFGEEGNREDAFREYQYWIERYAATSPVEGATYESAVAAQFALANSLRADLGGGPLSPSAEMVASMFRHVVANAPDSPRAAEAVLSEGACYETDGAWAKAVNAYERLGAKYPASDLVPASRYRSAACRYRLAKRQPNDEATLRNALEMLRFALRTDPQNPEAPEARARAEELSARQTRMAFERAEFYDRVRRDPEAAVLAYGDFLKQFPNTPESARARERMEALRPAAAAASADAAGQ